MVDLLEEIYAALKTIPDAEQVNYQYPQDWATLPAVTYYEQSNTEMRVFGGSNYMANVSYQIDIWAKMPEQCRVIAYNVDDRMAALGLRREFSADLFDPSGIHHRSKRYAGKYNPATNIID